MRSLELLTALTWSAAAAPSSIDGRAPGLKLADFVEPPATIFDGNTSPHQKRAINVHDCGAEEVNSALDICATRAAEAEKAAQDPNSNLVQEFFKDGSQETRNGVAEVFKRIALESIANARTLTPNGPAFKPELENPMVSPAEDVAGNGGLGLSPGTPPINAVTFPGTPPVDAGPDMPPGIPPVNVGPGILKARGPAPQVQTLDIPGTMPDGPVAAPIPGGPDVGPMAGPIPGGPGAGPVPGGPDEGPGAGNNPSTDPIPITLCPNFFNLESDASRSNSPRGCEVLDKPGVMIHEMSHVLANTKDLAGYGTAVVSSLGSKENKKHADTFALFAQAVALKCPGPAETAARGGQGPVGIGSGGTAGANPLAGLGNPLAGLGNLLAGLGNLLADLGNPQNDVNFPQ